nr:LOW QUALITY PROTEIN: protein cornichon homolog 4-like [Equus asinus]
MGLSGVCPPTLESHSLHLPPSPSKKERGKLNNLLRNKSENWGDDQTNCTNVDFTIKKQRERERRRKVEAVVVILSLLGCCVLTFLSVHFIITLCDLGCDCINARPCSSKLNKRVIPEFTGHTTVTALMLTSLHSFIFLLNLPVVTWNIYQFIMVPGDKMGPFDPTEIHNRRELKSHRKEATIMLGFHLLCFFMYLYSMILALIND